ncbi:PadR family transcriptional regulator [Ornithinibacillus halophilus]|uniref:Transcriptional regulator, PadR family n=1 Tax=Ornithinibacillus halophilus TaxID=930117 RepID=A0A1M5DYW5_9BACI|nr:PadR family transcriptional regulator [Ornithinibacillus halophilus]SHF72187.1 transcriptional regulator, PadR family [Ornithinibacillus halophilus]
MKRAEEFLPLSQATYYILLSLREVRHGYGIIKDVEEISHGEVSMGPGTLYGALGKLEKQSIITKSKEIKGDRRKFYELTFLGKEVLLLEFKRLNSLVDNAKEYIEQLEGENNDNKEV